MIMLTGLFSCARKSKHIPDVAHLDSRFSLENTASQLFLSGSFDAPGLADLRAEDPDFWNLYFRQIVPLEKQDEPADSLLYRLNRFIQEPGVRWLYDTTAQIFEDFADLKREFSQAFQFYQYYFPEREVPAVYTMLTDFAYFPFIFQDSRSQDALGVSLEMFLGREFPYQRLLGNHPAFSDYLLRTFNSDHLVKKSLDVLIDDLMGPMSGDRLLDYMVHNGKHLFILDQLLPYAPDSVLFEYRPEQITWCRDNARNIWAFLLSEDLLYSNDFAKFKKLVQHSPNVPGMPPEAPGQVANWVGLQIISAFMARNPDLSLDDLIAHRDAQQILTESRYKPRR